MRKPGWGEFCSEIHGMDTRLQNEDEIIEAIRIYSAYGSSITRKNLNIKFLLSIIDRMKSGSITPAN
jgi:hypothetical protein